MAKKVLDAVQGTTPTFSIVVKDDLTEKTIEIYISGKSGLLLLSGDRIRMAYLNEKTTIAFQLTQKETLKMKPGLYNVQLRYIGDDENAEATMEDAVKIHILPLSADHEIKREGVNGNE